jgi:hypothetical protein
MAKKGNREFVIGIFQPQTEFNCNSLQWIHKNKYLPDHCLAVNAPYRNLTRSIFRVVSGKFWRGHCRPNHIAQLISSSTRLTRREKCVKAGGSRRHVGEPVVRRLSRGSGEGEGNSPTYHVCRSWNTPPGRDHYRTVTIQKALKALRFKSCRTWSIEPVTMSATSGGDGVPDWDEWRAGLSPVSPDSTGSGRVDQLFRVRILSPR